MTTPLDKTLKRELTIEGRPYVIAISPAGLKLTLKGKRNGLELGWADLVSGEAALARALHASIGQFVTATAAAPDLQKPAPLKAAPRPKKAAVVRRPAKTRRARRV